ncbi:HAMP domain-containing protein [Ramlibacter sp. G-1-2-2]|uniref:histidine kinase n=1 Tax=Ramlibacter agri TaxID=2728837 RepID=A0A848H4W7_9BURK|nr:HAMP domain-containing protein [Ramlibacter agri]NML45604.1 HAMP domain-containing protein [Ramlibacter agri]
MTLRLKIHLIVGALTLLFLVALLAEQFDGMRKSVNEEVVAANRVAAQMLRRAVWGAAAQGPEALRAYLEGMGRVRSNDITLVDAAGAELYRSPPSTYKEGRNAPDWFEDLISPPPSSQSIQFPDGTLTVRSNASRAALDAWDEFVPLMGQSLLVLLAANAAVFWLVGRAVRPFGRIVVALNEVETGRFDTELPRLPGKEAGAIGEAFNRMVGMLRRNIESERRAAIAERELNDSRELAHWVAGQIEQERRSIARELHDELGQSVTAIRSMALSIAQRARGIDAESERAARVIADESSRLYEAMHGLIPRLAPLVLDNFGLREALADLVERTRRSHPDVRIELDAQLADARPSAEVALTLYRAAQEGITNALRHGQARTLRLQLRVVADGIELQLLDDGRGLPADWPEHRGQRGLRWLAERVESVGGSCSVERGSTGGVRLQVSVPVDEAAEALA